MSNKVRFLALIIIILMAVSMISSFVIVGSVAKAQSVDDMQQQLEELAKKKQKLEQELNAISQKKKNELEKKSIIDEQVNATRDEINVLNGVINSLDKQLDNAQNELDTASKTLDEKLQLSKNRIRSAYEQGEASYLEIIIQSKSVYDFISKIEIVSQIANRDKEVIEQVKKSKETIEAKKIEIEQSKAEKEKNAESLKSKQNSLSKKQAQSDQLIQEINSDAAATKRAVLAAEAEEEKLQAEIRKMLSSSGNSELIDTGEFRWPLNTKFNNITSKFGYRTHPVTGKYKLHTGVDIASSGIKGSSIYAAKGGTVLKAGYNTGYGNYVLIDHGGGYATLYGHASTLTVSAGQNVSRGDVLGYVGSTGYSTGPHLHFEIIKNGEYTNPLTYFSGVMSFTYY